jgi:CspA family cold shock protein
MSVAGSVKFFNSDKGYGFIKRDDGQKDVFLHARDLRRSDIHDEVSENDHLTFEIEDKGQGPRAINISRTE